MAECKPLIFAVVGPTASGKTALGVEICKKLGGEVISCDSMQIYKGMDIATAKPSAEEMQGIPHHLIGFVDPVCEYSVAAYCDEAAKAAEDIISRGRVPVLVGGTGLYYSSFSDNIRFPGAASDPALRQELKETAQREGTGALLERLREVDPERAARLHENDTDRIIRALEVYILTGQTITRQEQLSRSEPSPFRFVTAFLDARHRAYLYDRINRRVDMMLESGLLDEANRFYDSERGKTAVQAIGYKELFPYFEGVASLEECVENLKMQTRRYAKRQLTWFRRDERAKAFYIDDYPDTASLAEAVLEYFIKEGDAGVK